MGSEDDSTGKRERRPSVFEITRGEVETLMRTEGGQLSRKQAHTVVDRFYDAKEDLERIHREFERIKELYLEAIERSVGPRSKTSENTKNRQKRK